MTTSSPLRLTGYINYSNDITWKLWAKLEDAVREGTHRWQQTFGWDGPIFSHFFKTEEAKREFLIGMHGLGLLSSPHVVSAFDLGRYRRLVDLGGATGHLAIAACQRYPDLHAIVFDLPDAVGLAQEIVRASSVADRIEIVAGDFFLDPLTDERDIAKQLYDKFPDSREDRCREWKERTGKSERALYRRAAELGLDAPPRYLSMEDIEEFDQESVNLSIEAD